MTKDNIFNKDGMYFLPLGGADEIGINMYVYAVDGKLIVVDCGYGFLNDSFPGTDLSLADASFLEDYQDDIEGLFITHAHEDHFGAIGHIWPKLKCPVFGTDFSIGMIKERLKEYKLDGVVPLNTIPESRKIKLPNFEVEYAYVVHNVPETAALIIRTKYGNVVHATDFRFDDGKSEFLPTDYEALRKIGEEGVSLLICDSTNITVKEEKQLSESDVRESLVKLIPTLQNTVAVTCFSSNLTRLETLMLAAKQAERTPVLVGRSIIQNVKVAKSCGYFKDLPQALDLREASEIPSDKALYICTGSQADYRSALTLIAKDEKKEIKLGSGDTVIFSSRIIPGNEKAIEDMQENLVKMGVDVITSDEYLVHTTGHSNKRDLEKMYGILKPEVIIPVHGDKRFIKAHKKFAQEYGIKQVITTDNGNIFLIKNNKIEKVGEVFVDVLAVDRKHVISISSEVLKNRKRIAYHCSVFISVVFSKDWKVEDLQISSIDILEKDLWDELCNDIKEDMLARIPEQLPRLNHKEVAISDYIRSYIRKKILSATDIKPITFIHLYKNS